MNLPEDIWVAEVSMQFPDATFRLLTGVPKNDRAIELGEIRADDPEAAAAALRNHPDTVAYERLIVTDGRAIIQYEAVEQRLYEFLWGSSLPPEFPVIVENGEMEFDLTVTREQFESFGEVLDASGCQYNLIRAVDTGEEDALLTERQQECLSTAQRLGYFDVPRECTLAELANELGVDKSTASETIRRGTSRVVGQFLLHD
jgi:predicted DNA binding protein